MLKLVSPSVHYLVSYRKAVEDGFQNMQLGFGDSKPDSVDYLPQITNPAPFQFNGYSVYEHQLLWLVNADDFVGSVACRFKSDPEIEKVCGHIGIAIAAPYRRKGYATQGIELAKGSFLQHGMKEILYTVSPTNTASVALVQKAQGEKIDHLPNPLGFGPTDIYRIKL